MNFRTNAPQSLGTHASGPFTVRDLELLDLTPTLDMSVESEDGTSIELVFDGSKGSQFVVK